jgi:sensor histidine kinase YesM
MKWLQHLVFWVLSIYAVTEFFSISNNFKIVDLIYSLLFHGCLFPLVYLNLGLLIPHFFRKNRYWIYLPLLGLDILLAYGIHEGIFNYLTPLLEDFYLVSFSDPWLLLIIFGIYLFITTLLKLSRSWFQLQQLEKEKLQLELNALKAQINPHFLFNGLNSIYSLAFHQKPEAPEAVLKLSNLLRYVLYEVNQEMIAIDQEMDMLHQYIDLQKLRVSDPEAISFATEVKEKQDLPPMILLPLIENAFKHGDGKLSAQLKADEQGIVFSCSNIIAEKNQPEQEKQGGIGLENIQRRLSLMYDDHHSLEKSIEQGIYKVELTLPKRP